MFHLGQRQKFLLISVALVGLKKYFARVTLPGLFLVKLWHQKLEQGPDKFLF